MKIGRLVLGRKAGQSIMVGKDIRVTIASTRGGLVRVAIEAPTNIKVLRSELDDYSSESQGMAKSQEIQPKTNGNLALSR